MEEQVEYSPKQPEEKEIDGIWGVLNSVGVVLIFLSIIAGLIFITEYESPMIGLVIILQGGITGVLFMGFSKLGELVNKIEKSLTKKN